MQTAEDKKLEENLYELPPDGLDEFEAKLTLEEKKLVEVEKTANADEYDTHFAKTFITENQNKDKKLWTLHDIKMP